MVSFLAHSLLVGGGCGFGANRLKFAFEVVVFLQHVVELGLELLEFEVSVEFKRLSCLG